ncbi:hypothetical protein Taro_018349, partial [Colocasia esculenta]|nr:hypothetical protein [Colocasia esculenta]
VTVLSSKRPRLGREGRAALHVIPGASSLPPPCGSVGAQMVAPPPRVPLRHPHRLFSLSSPFPASPLPPSQPAPADTGRSFFPRRRFRCRCSTLGGSHPAWESNAERVRPRKSGGGAGARRGAEEVEGWGHRRRAKRRWWSDETYDDEWDDDADFDLLDDDFEQPWEKIWIFKVFKSYGYFLPAIIASMLLATGPKAFLMALALPLGQSALSLAIDKLWGNASRERRRPRSKTKKKPFARSAGDLRREEGEGIGRGYQDRKAYQSWMAADAAAASDREAKSRAFGGWDELDRRKEYAEGPARQQPSKKASASSSRAPPIREGKLSRRERNKEVPLFLRLLVAVFPFLGSWTRIL